MSESNGGFVRRAKSGLKRVPLAERPIAKLNELRISLPPRLHAASRAAKGLSPFGDYPVESRPRWGYGLPPHPQLDDIIGRGRPRYNALVKAILAEERLSQIHGSADASQPELPHWNNGMFPAIDGAALYVLMGRLRPKLVIEVGSGNSTRFSRLAISDADLDTVIVSIDPHPRVEIDALCDETVRSAFESLDLSLLDRLQPGDVLFFDGSHRSLMNSDVTMFWLDAIPRLPRGVIVHIHDIFLPYDYPPDWTPRFYSEQYLLAAALLAGADFGLLFASQYVQQDADLFTPLDERFASWGVDLDARGGASFWFVIGADIDPLSEEIEMSSESV